MKLVAGYYEFTGLYCLRGFVPNKQLFYKDIIMKNKSKKLEIIDTAKTLREKFQEQLRLNKEKKEKEKKGKTESHSEDNTGKP